MVTKQILGARIREARERAGWSQDELAQKVKKNQREISEYENGKRRMYFDDLVRFAEAFGVPIDHLVYGTDKSLDEFLLSEFRALPDDRTRRTAIALMRVLRDAGLEES